MMNYKIIFASTIIALLFTWNQSNAQKMEREQHIAVIAAFTAKGDLQNLNHVLNDALDSKMTINEIKEVLIQLYAYTGFPRSLNALSTLMEVTHQRKQNGITDILGKEASPLPTDKAVQELGTEIQTMLVGQPVKGALYEFAPTIDVFLKSHLFGDIFGRDILDYKSREIATIAALSCLEGAEGQLRSHINIGMNLGITEKQLRTFIATIESKVGNKESNRAESVLNNLQEKFPLGELIQKSPNFSGDTWLKMVSENAEAFDCIIGNVTFAAGVRNSWHSHPGGQILLCTYGEGFYQEKGQPVKRIKAGDVIEILPDVIHWHGATHNSQLTHIAISTRISKGAAVWMEPVTDEEYQNLLNE